jgi:hypothetical protein
MGWIDFEQGVKNLSGHGSAEGGEQKFFPSAVLPRWGKTNAPARKQDKPDS